MSRELQSPPERTVSAVAEAPALTVRQRWRKWLDSSTPEMRVGTLQYTGAGMLIMFLWLFWGDIIFTLSEAVFPISITLQLDRLGIPKFWIGLLKGTAAASVSTFFVPMIGFRSDRTRTRLGRRIPYILWTLIPVTISLAALGFTDDIGRWIRTSDWPGRLGVSENTMIVMVVGSMIIIFDIANVFISTVWWFLLRDVVPNHYIIRFMAAFGVVATIMNMTFNYFVAWRVETHTRSIYLGAAALYLVGFLIVCFKIKEGEYPPVSAADKREPVFKRFGKAVKLYFAQCFSHPLIFMLYIWAAIGAFQIGANAYQYLYLTRHLNFSLWEQNLYWVWQGWAILIIKYPIGASLHRWVHPMKGLFYATLCLLPLPWLYFMVGNYQLGSFFLSAYTMWVLINMWQCPLTQMHYLSLYPLQTRLFPQENFGQFRSAETMVISFISIFAGAFQAAIVGDWMYAKFGTYGYGITYLWQGIFSLIGFTCLCVVFYYWKIYGGANFDMRSHTGVTRGQLWRPMKVAGVAVGMIIGLAITMGVILSRRPDFGFEVNKDKELFTAKSLPQLLERVTYERQSFFLRHENNVRILAEKRLFWQADSYRESYNFNKALIELELHWSNGVLAAAEARGREAAASAVRASASVTAPVEATQGPQR